MQTNGNSETNPFRLARRQTLGPGSEHGAPTGSQPKLEGNEWRPGATTAYTGNANNPSATGGCLFLTYAVRQLILDVVSHLKNHGRISGFPLRLRSQQGSKHRATILLGT